MRTLLCGKRASVFSASPPEGRCRAVLCIYFILIYLYLLFEPPPRAPVRSSRMSPGGCGPLFDLEVFLGVQPPTRPHQPRHYFSRRFVLPAAARALETLHCCGLATGVVVSPVCTHTHTLSLSFLLLCASLISLYLCHTSPSLFVTALFASLATCLP